MLSIKNIRFHNQTHCAICIKEIDWMTTNHQQPRKEWLMTLINTTPITRRPRASFFGTLMQLAAISRQRKALARLDDAALDDIGVSRAEADREASRPIWDAPETWRC